MSRKIYRMLSIVTEASFYHHCRLYQLEILIFKVQSIIYCHTRQDSTICEKQTKERGKSLDHLQEGSSLSSHKAVLARHTDEYKSNGISSLSVISRNKFCIVPAYYVCIVRKASKLTIHEGVRENSIEPAKQLWF